MFLRFKSAAAIDAPVVLGGGRGGGGGHSIAPIAVAMQVFCAAAALRKAAAASLLMVARGDVGRPPPLPGKQVGGPAGAGWCGLAVGGTVILPTPLSIAIETS